MKNKIVICCIVGLVHFFQTTGAYGAEIPHNKNEYLIGAEDVLEILVWKNEDISKTVVVRPDGKISLPLVGDVVASGLTPDQFQERLLERLKEYQDVPVVSVIVQQVNSYNFFVIGEVLSPGTYALKKKTTLIQALAMAGGFSQFAKKNKIILIRNQFDRGGQKKIVVNFKDIVDENKRTNQNFVLKPGDTIFVP